MTHEEQVKIYQDEAKRVGFLNFQKETTKRVVALVEDGYTLDQAIELLKVYALQTIAEQLNR
jgi:hypothetical protein